MRKKSEEEKKEDEKIAEIVNATLAEEEEKRKQEEKNKRKETGKAEKGKNMDQVEGTTDNGPKKKEEVVEPEKKEEACNITCPIVDPCTPCGPCPEVRKCPPCERCPKKEECPPIDCGPCPEVRPCKPCGPCPVIHNETMPSVNQCPENRDLAMTIPVAMAVGAAASLLVVGVATAVGLVIRYVPPTVSGFLFVATIIIVWYLSSHYPDTARELGGRVVEVLREATTTLSHRILAALRHHDQVSFSLILTSLD